jgi:hypothetical protein
MEPSALFLGDINTGTSQIGNNVKARVFNAGLLARSQFHPEGLTTGQLDQGYPWFSLVSEKMLSWYPNFTLHCMLLMQPSKCYLHKISP